MSFKTKVCSIELENPLILASGVQGTSYSTLQRMYEAGLGAVVTRSIGIKPRSGNPNPSIFALQDIRSVISSVGLANPGYSIYKDDIIKAINNKVPTIVSIFGKTIEEFEEVFEGLKDIPPLAFELNIERLDQHPDIILELVQSLKKKTKIPLWVKLTPNDNNMSIIAAAAVQGRCDALVAINTVKAMVIDIQTRQPFLGAKKGGLSGAAIKPIGIRCVYDLYEQFGDKTPIIGVGGISKGEDVIEYILAGASAVQIGTAIGVTYPENMIKFIQMKMKNYLKEHGIKTISELIGGAHK